MNGFGISFSYLLATICGLVAAYQMNKANPDMNAIVKFFVLPILVIYVVLKFFQFVFPHINKFGSDAVAYVEDKTLGEINEMGYMQIFPMFFAIIIIFFVLLYSGAF